MLEHLRNLRMPGRRPSTSRRRAQLRRPAPATRREFTVGRLQRPEPVREIQLPWRRIGIWAGSVFGACAVLYVMAWVFTSDTFRVRDINVVGAQVEDPRAVAFAGDLGGASMFFLDTAAAEAAIEELPGVKSASVSRDWPHGVRVQVEEHQAWGHWQVADEVIEIDAEGQILERARPAPEGAPTIIELAGPRADGESAVDADTVRLVAQLIEDGAFDTVGVDPLGFVFRRDRGLVVLSQGAPDVVFGDSSNYEFKVQAWQGLVSQIKNNQVEAREIDLRFGRNVVLR